MLNKELLGITIGFTPLWWSLYFKRYPNEKSERTGFCISIGPLWIRVDY